MTYPFLGFFKEASTHYFVSANTPSSPPPATAHASDSALAVDYAHVISATTAPY